MFLENVTITRNKKLNEKFYHLSFRSAKIARSISCGQFLFVKVSNTHDPLLRRPLSVAWVFGGQINIVYKVVGRGTALLAGKNEGDKLNVMGPLGKGFTHPFPEVNFNKASSCSFNDDRKIILVAGGIGIASLISLTKMCVRKNVHLFYGVRTKKEFLSERFLSINRKNITYATEDGSRGYKGFVTEVLEKYLKKSSNKKNYIYTCGPLEMLRNVVVLANKYNVDGEANLEERMACGVGACLGCATETAHGVKMVCKDGPVFSFSDLGWK